MAQDLFSERSARTYFEAVVAAILATRTVAVEWPNPDQMIKAHKETLQKVRETDIFNP